MLIRQLIKLIWYQVSWRYVSFVIKLEGYTALLTYKKEMTKTE